MLSKIGKVGDIWCNWSEVANCSQSFDSQAVGINKNMLFLQPGEQVIVWTLELDLAQMWLLNM